MSKLTVFNQVSLDGYFADDNDDMSWAHKSDPEWDAFVAGNAKGGSKLLFGRVTYDMMAGFWPTPAARAMAPDVADGMNKTPKVVFSKSMTSASWSNTTVVSGDIVAAVRKMKTEPGGDMTVLGSGSIVAQLAAAGVVDEFNLVVNPLALGGGRTLFAGIGERLALKLTSTRSFTNGNVLLGYVPLA